MTFPTYGLLDDFTRADAASLGANWTTAPIEPGDSELGILGNAAHADTDSDGGGSLWAPTPFTGSVESWATVNGYVQVPYVAACVNGGDTAGWTGYALQLDYSGGDVILTDYRVDGGWADATELSATNVGLFSAGMSFGLRVNGGSIEVWYKGVAGSWTLVQTDTDSTYTYGRIGLGFNGYGGVTAGFTAFGGGGTPDVLSTGRPVPYAPPTRRGLLLSVTDLTGAVLVNGTARPIPVQTPDQPQVTVPLSDSRTGQLAVSMYEPIAGALQAATTVVKVLYVNPKGDEVLLLNGIVMNPQEDFDAGTVTVTLHDHTIRLKKRNLGYNHASILLATGITVNEDGEAYSAAVLDAVGLGEFYGINSDYGIPLDGYGLRLMMLDTSHGASDWPGGGFSSVPSMGIRYGVDNANRQPAYGSQGIPPQGFTFTADTTEGNDTLTSVTFPGGQTIADVYTYGALHGAGIADFAQVASASGTSIVMSQPATATATGVTITLEDAIYCQLSRGDIVYDDWTEMVQAQGAFECDFVPVDATHLGFSGDAWSAGQFVELYTDNRVGTNRSQSQSAVTPVVFVHGLGGFHIQGSPDADSLITYEVQVGPGGPWDPLDLFNKVTLNSDKVTTYGIWEDWEQNTSAGTGDTPISNAVLTNRAEAVLTGYQDPPKFLTCTLDLDRAGTYCYGTDFFLGDTVTVFAKKGYRTLGPMDVRITSVGITQIDHDGNCQLVMSMVPYLTTDAGVTEGA